MNTVEIMGGLGNQLFQIFALIAYSLKHQTPFYFSQEPIKNGQRKQTYWSTPLLQALQQFIKANDSASLLFREPNFHYNALPAPPPNKPPIKLYGYFQSYKYFQEQQAEIYKLFHLNENRKKMFEATKNQYNYAITLAMHFRLGDYIKLPNHHPLMPLAYYTQALMNLLQTAAAKATTLEQAQQQTVQQFNVLYFCEQADEAYIQKQMITPLQENPLFHNRFTFQCINHQFQDWEQLLIMSLCEAGHIIANSTFSWWGAYLSEEATAPINISPDKGGLRACFAEACFAGGSTPDKGGLRGSTPVYYPKTWFGSAMGNKNMQDLFPPHWPRIDI